MVWNHMAKKQTVGAAGANTTCQENNDFEPPADGSIHQPFINNQSSITSAFRHRKDFLTAGFV